MSEIDYFSRLKQAPPVEVFAMIDKCVADLSPKKVDLGVGVYKSDDGTPYNLPVVIKVEKQMCNNSNHDYLPILGNADFRDASIKLLLGEDNPHLNKVGGVQSIGGTGAVRTGLEFLKACLGYNIVYVSKPTWVNHVDIAESIGYTDVRTYAYWDYKNRCLDMENMLKDFSAAPEKSVIILHTCSHNPTGMDPTKTQWSDIADVLKDKGCFVFFDAAYIGFSSGDPAIDSYPVRLFQQRGFQFFTAQSFSKNFSLYGERVGHLTFVAGSPQEVSIVLSHFTTIVRRTNSNPPNHGSAIITTILNDPKLRQEWLDSVKMMAKRIRKMRQLLFNKLNEIQTPGNWDHIIRQTGMFSFTGLTRNQVEFLIKEKHVYLLSDGRVNVCAVTTSNVQYIAESIKESILEFKCNSLDK